MAGGRPTKYDAKTHIAAVLSADCLRRGATLAVMAEECGVSVPTVRSWMQRHPEFLAAVKGAADMVDDAVESAFCSNATGGAVKSRNLDRYGREVIEYFAPDTTAGIFWLCNRRPDRWRHVQRIEHTGEDGGAITITELVRRASED